MLNTPVKRIVYRLVEIGAISAAIGVLTAPQFESIVPPLMTGVVAAITKSLRELRSKLKKGKE